MIVEAQVTINGSSERIWAVITDIGNATETISSIQNVEVLEKPENGFVGLKWRETRTLFGKTATEVMWITDAVENEYYKARAESHGFIYISTFSISGQNGERSLTMNHDSRPQSLVAKLLSPPMGIVFKGLMKKAILKDLQDIKVAVEQQSSEQTA